MLPSGTWLAKSGRTVGGMSTADGILGFNELEKGDHDGKGVVGPCYWPQSFVGGSSVWAIITVNVPMVAFWQHQDSNESSLRRGCS